MVTEGETEVLDSLLEKVYRAGGQDFRGYRRGTVVRRLERRLRVTGMTTYQAYIDFLGSHPEEYYALTECLTITVSGFFRSPYTFDQKKRRVLPELVRNKKEHGWRGLSLWSAACARGEEPYSMAITVSEFLGAGYRDFQATIYATDVNQAALAAAETGRYPLKYVEGVPPDLLERYFTRLDDSYEVNADIRRMVKFSCYNLVSSAPLPFINLDCIFCCNVLIYLQRDIQEGVLDTLYSSLNSPGYLVLGEVETPAGDMQYKLRCLDNRAKIYLKE